MRHYEVVETIYKRFETTDKVLFKMTRRFQYIYDLNSLEKADDIYVQIIGNFKEIAKKQNGVINEYPVNSRESDLLKKLRADKMAEMISDNVRCVVILSTVDDKIDTIELCEKPGRKPIETKLEKVKIDNKGGFRYEKKH